MTKISISRDYIIQVCSSFENGLWIGVGSEKMLGTCLNYRLLGSSDLKVVEQTTKSSQEFTAVSNACEWENPTGKGNI